MSVLGQILPPIFTGSIILILNIYMQAILTLLKRSTSVRKKLQNTICDYLSFCSPTWNKWKKQVLQIVAYNLV